MKKTLTIIGLIALLAVGGVALLVATKDKPAEKERAAQAASKDSSDASAQDAQVAIPSGADPNDPERVKRVKEVNQVIAQVMQEAASRPKDDRMTPEEISALVRARIQELRASP